MLTNSAHQILKWLKNYCALLKPLSSRSEDIFNGICDLFDAYFLDVFLFVGGISLSQLVWEDDLITTRLKTTLLRILKRDGKKHKEEIERIEASKPPSRTSSALTAHKFTFEIKNFTNRFNTTRSPLTTNGTPAGHIRGCYGTEGEVVVCRRDLWHGRESPNECLIRSSGFAVGREQSLRFA